MDVNDIDNFCEITMYFVCILYADDTALIATNASDLQHSLCFSSTVINGN